jgi:hypothetical protein
MPRADLIHYGSLERPSEKAAGVLGGDDLVLRDESCAAAVEHVRSSSGSGEEP